MCLSRPSAGADKPVAGRGPPRTVGHSRAKRYIKADLAVHWPTVDNRLSTEQGASRVAKSPDPVRWGIVGTANIARAQFLPGLREAGGGTAALVASRDRARADAFAAA